MTWSSRFNAFPRGGSKSEERLFLQYQWREEQAGIRPMKKAGEKTKVAKEKRKDNELGRARSIRLSVYRGFVYVKSTGKIYMLRRTSDGQFSTDSFHLSFLFILGVNVEVLQSMQVFPCKFFFNGKCFQRTCADGSVSKEAFLPVQGTRYIHTYIQYVYTELFSEDKTEIPASPHRYSVAIYTYTYIYLA